MAKMKTTRISSSKSSSSTSSASSGSKMITTTFAPTPAPSISIKSPSNITVTNNPKTVSDITNPTGYTYNDGLQMYTNKAPTAGITTYSLPKEPAPTALTAQAISQAAGYVPPVQSMVGGTSAKKAATPTIKTTFSNKNLNYQKQGIGIQRKQNFTGDNQTFNIAGQDVTRKKLEDTIGRPLSASDLQEYQQTGTFDRNIFNKPQAPTTATPTSPQVPQVPQIPQTPTTTPTEPAKIPEGFSYQYTNPKGEKVYTDAQGNTKTETELTAQKNDYIVGVDELSPEEKQVYDMLSPQEQANFRAIGENARKKGQDYVKQQLKYLNAWKAEKKYSAEQYGLSQEIQANNDRIAKIQANETLNNAKTQLDGLRQRIAYMGSMGAAGVSTARLEGLSKQITNAENTYKNMLETQDLLEQSRTLGKEMDVKKFERDMQLLQDDLDAKVDKVIQDSEIQINQAGELGQLDTIEDVENLRVKLLDSLDKEISGITDANIMQRQYLIDQYDKQATEIKDYIKNRTVVNKDMSGVLGYYVDGNGEAMIDANGQRISLPTEAPMEPVFDSKTGRLIQFTTDDTGNIKANVTQVIDQPSFIESTISSFAQAVVDGKLGFNDVPENVRNTDSFIQALAQTQKQQAPKLTEVQPGNVVIDEKGNVVYGGTTTPSGTFQDLTGTLKRPQGSTNIGQDTNNPGNIMAENPKQVEYAKSLGAIGFYKSPNGRTYAVFPDMESGLNATISDINTKLSGGSSWVNNQTTLAQLASGWTSGPNAPLNQNAVNNYVKLTGYNANTPISNIPKDVLISAIVANEGVDTTKSADTSYITPAQGNDDAMKAMSLVQGLGGTEGERKQFQDNIITVAKRDGISLEEAKKKLNYKSADDVEFAKTRKEDFQTFKKGITASTGNARTALTLLNQPQTAIADVASIVGFLKTIDPSSVARESEVASVENARGILDTISNVFQKAKEGTKLTDTQRQQLKGAIKTIVDASDKKYDEYVSSLVDEFDSRGLDASVYIPKKDVEKAKVKPPESINIQGNLGQQGAGLGAALGFGIPTENNIMDIDGFKIDLSKQGLQADEDKELNSLFQ